MGVYAIEWSWYLSQVPDEFMLSREIWVFGFEVARVDQPLSHLEEFQLLLRHRDDAGEVVELFLGRPRIDCSSLIEVSVEIPSYFLLVGLQGLLNLRFHSTGVDSDKPHEQSRTVDHIQSAFLVPDLKGYHGRVCPTSGLEFCSLTLGINAKRLGNMSNTHPLGAILLKGPDRLGCSRDRNGDISFTLIFVNGSHFLILSY